jgi:hypothetical protein
MTQTLQERFYGEAVGTAPKTGNVEIFCCNRLQCAVLANFLATQGKNVALVDMDVRKGGISK